ncbi:unnamed protein product [Adineta steineri]|uniref:Uncharacterized protein n=1 Tax=Adineta steineri TaxID=433720 RepID=A0A813UA70_9BILA|nr:unnamed protein product [Adineta steineri]CAF3712262.1 unnamed protein product [Adineta steineri]
MKPDSSTMSTNFDRPKLLLFKFLAHQIHPFAYAVNTFLRPALDDCIALIRTNPQDTFNVLLSLTQTFTRFAPESELIYDDIQQFAIQLKDAIDQCFTCLDPNTIQQSSELLESTHQSLSEIIQQQNAGNTTYTNMYKNMSAVLTNLEKINSLPLEMQKIDNRIPSQKINRQETIMNVNGRTDSSLIHNEYTNRNSSIASNRTITPPPGIPQIQMNKPSVIIPPITANPNLLSRLSQNTVLPPPTPLMNQMKTLSISSTPVPTTTLSSRPVSTISYLGEYEVVDTNTQPTKKPTIGIASFPPRQNASLFPHIPSINDKSLTTSTTISKPNTINDHYITSPINELMKVDHGWPQSKPNTINDHHLTSPINELMKVGQGWLQSKSNNNNKTEIINQQPRATPTPISSHDSSFRSMNMSGLRTASATPSIHENTDDDRKENIQRQAFATAHFAVPKPVHTDWQPPKDNRSTVSEQSSLSQTKSSVRAHITEEYIQEFGNKQGRPALCGELSMTFGTPQNGPQSTCLPIGVGLSYDELTLLSCDVHRSAQHVRLFDIQSGRLKHTITSNQHMRLHRPGAVMSNTRNNILIVERDSIYITETDGRLIQTLGHRNIKQLYGIASFRDRYVLTIDSKTIDSQSGETCRVLLFDPNSNKLVFEQNITINQQSENILMEQYTHHIQGKIIPESMSKPRFLAVHNDDIYIADLGRSLIYGTTLRNQFDLTSTTVFGGHGRTVGEMNEPSGLFIDSGGNIISADSKNDRIQLFASNGQYKTTFKLNERIKRPSGICSNRDGTQFYVSCYLGGCVRAFNVGY